MARDRASIRIDMWGDGDWRDLPIGAQHLYMLLLSHPTLSYAGVAEWHPGKLAAMTAQATADEVVAGAAVLESAGFIVVEPSTDEVLVRSFIKHDGLMKQPKLVVSMANAYAAVASRRIQLVIAYEVQKMAAREPELRAWGVKQVQTVLSARANAWSDVGLVFTPGFTPDVTPGFTPDVTPNGGQGLAVPTTTATTTATRTSSTSSKTDDLETAFLEAWEHWPKKTERKRSFDKFKIAIRAKPVGELVEAITKFGEAYGQHVKTDYTPSLAVWLNGERWTDDLPGSASPNQPSKRVPVNDEWMYR